MDRAGRLPSSGCSRTSPRGPIWLVATVLGVLQLGACQDATEESDDAFEQLCPEGGSVVIRNATGKGIRELQIRGLDEGVEPTTLTGEAGLADGGEVTWGSCSAQAQALVITFDDGSTEQTEVPTLVPTSRRLTLSPSTGGQPPQPAPSKPSRQLDVDVTGSNVPMTR